jgi:hypothetical protein
MIADLATACTVRAICAALSVWDRVEALRDRWHALTRWV